MDPSGSAGFRTGGITMDLHALMSPYADGGAPLDETLEEFSGRHRADGPAVQRQDVWGHQTEPRHRGADRAEWSDALTSL